MSKITRREIIKKALYVAPVILTLTAVPTLARAGSGNAVSDLAHQDPHSVSGLAQQGPNSVSNFLKNNSH